MRGALLLLGSVPGLAKLRSPDFATRVFALVACAVILGGTASYIGLTRSMAMADARIESANLAKSIAEQAAATFSAADILLEVVADGWQSEALASEPYGQVQRALQRLSAQSHIRTLAVYSLDGRLLSTSLPTEPGVPTQLTAAELALHDSHRSGTVLIAAVSTGGPEEHQNIAVWRRLQTMDGQSGGVVLALVDAESLLRFSNSLRAEPSGAIGLMRQDGEILTGGSGLAAKIAQTAMLKRYQQHGFAGNFDVISSKDGKRQLASLSPIDGYPLVAFVAFDEAELLGHWRANAYFASLVAAVLCLGTASAGWFIAGQIKRAETTLRTVNAQLQQTVMQDALTGIANRRLFDSVLQREQRRAARTQHPLALLMLDVDHFKSFNDTYGHQAGDACLQSIARTIARLAQRPADLAARLGGEEFVILLPETDTAGATVLAERLRKAIYQLQIPHGRGLDGVVTVSIGIAVVWPQPPNGANADLVSLADAALYMPKAQGRDCACVSPLCAPTRSPCETKAWIMSPDERSGAKC